MRRLIYSLCILALLGTSACSSSGEVVYTGQNADAREGDYIKDPEAVGTTRDGDNRADVTRTTSNRVDIPVLEFAHVMSETNGAAMRTRSGYGIRRTLQSFAAGFFVQYMERRTGVRGYDDTATYEMFQAERNGTRYAGLASREQLGSRRSIARTSAVSGFNFPWTETGESATDGLYANASVQAMRSEAYLHATSADSGYESAFSARVIGLHLWKYADREIVADAVEITYTIVYYNTNEYNTGPTEIIEPVPYYTEYVENSATLPREGTRVEYVEREERDVLSWSFPDGIEPGETNEMTYKVTVKLDQSYKSRPSAPPNKQ